MVFIPIFDLSVTAEDTDFTKYVNNYQYWSQLAPSTDAQIQVEIDIASERIYDFTGYWPLQTSQSITIAIDPKTGYGALNKKLPSNLTSITTTDKRFSGSSLITDDVELFNDGRVHIKDGVYDDYYNQLYYPINATLTLDYGFTKSTQMPRSFKSVCVDLVMHYLAMKVDQGIIEMKTETEAQLKQEYNNPRKTELEILKRLSNVRI